MNNPPENHQRSIESIQVQSQQEEDLKWPLNTLPTAAAGSQHQFLLIMKAKNDYNVIKNGIAS